MKSKLQFESVGHFAWFWFFRQGCDASASIRVAMGWAAPVDQRTERGSAGAVSGERVADTVAGTTWKGSARAKSIYGKSKGLFTQVRVSLRRHKYLVTQSRRFHSIIMISRAKYC